jgi:hypothetical protein
MKYVSFLFALALIAIAGSAFATIATPFSFSFSSHNSFYSCSYAENQATKTLKALGANVVDMRCAGGIDFEKYEPVYLSGGFVLESQGGKTVVLKGRDSCEFNVQLIKNILATVNATVAKESHNCWDSEGNYRFEITVN